MRKVNLNEKYYSILKEQAASSGGLGGVLGGIGQFLAPNLGKLAGAGAGIYALERILGFGKDVLKASQGKSRGDNETETVRKSPEVNFDVVKAMVDKGELPEEHFAQIARLKSGGAKASDISSTLTQQAALASAMSRANRNRIESSAIESLKSDQNYQNQYNRYMELAKKGYSTLSDAEQKESKSAWKAIQSAKDKARKDASRKLYGDESAYQKYSSSYGRFHRGTSPMQPVEVRGGEATRKYGEMLRHPGGIKGAMAAQRAEETWKQWQAEDAVKDPSSPEYGWKAGERNKFIESEKQRIKADTKKEEMGLRATQTFLDTASNTTSPKGAVRSNKPMSQSTSTLTKTKSTSTKPITKQAGPAGSPRAK